MTLKSFSNKIFWKIAIIATQANHSQLLSFRHPMWTILTTIRLITSLSTKSSKVWTKHRTMEIWVWWEIWRIWWLGTTRVILWWLRTEWMRWIWIKIKIVEEFESYKKLKLMHNKLNINPFIYLIYFLI